MVYHTNAKMFYFIHTGVRVARKTIETKTSVFVWFMWVAYNIYNMMVIHDQVLWLLDRPNISDFFCLHVFFYLLKIACVNGRVLCSLELQERVYSCITI